MNSKGSAEVCEDSLMADARRVEQRYRYVSFNSIDDYQGRVENIEIFQQPPPSPLQPLTMDEREHFQGRLEGADAVQKD